MLLGSLQNFEWYNEPENVVFRDNGLHVTARQKTDFWQSRHHGFGLDNGHFFYCRREDDFSFVVKWSFEPHKPYEQCGIMLRIDEKNWVKASVIYDKPNQPMIGSFVTQCGYSDWAMQEIPGEMTDIWFKLKRRKGDYLLYFSPDGKIFRQIRLFHLQSDMPEVKIGAYLCNPGDGEFEAVLSQMEFISN